MFFYGSMLNQRNIMRERQKRKGEQRCTETFFTIQRLVGKKCLACL